MAPRPPLASPPTFPIVTQRSALAAAACLAALAACDSPSGPPDPPVDPIITVVSGAGVADSIDALLPQPLVVQVKGENGRPLANAEVVFLSTAVAEGSSQPTVLVMPTRGTGGGTSAVERTDAEGRAAIRLRMGRRAMLGGVVLAVPAIDDFIVAEYTIQPGAPVTVAAEPADTAIRVGAAFALRGSAVDRVGNPRGAEGVVYRLASGPAAVSGSTVTGSGVGRAAVVAELGAGVDTAWVSVVPQGTIAAYTRVLVSNQLASVYTMDLDGSSLNRRIVTGAGGGYSATMGTAWSADGSLLFYHDGNTDHTHSLYVLDVAGGTTRRLLPEADRMLEEAWPRVSNGWVYFEGGTFDDRPKGTVNDPVLYRVRPDGTEKTQVTPGEVVGTARHGAPSPDGLRLAYIGTFARPHPLQVMDLDDGEVTDLGVIALSPHWSPDGSEILYVAGDLTAGAGPLRAIRPDGTGDRAVTTGPTRYSAHFDLSPDGRYIIAASDQGVLTVIDFATGAELPIRTPALTQGLVAPSWRP